MNRLSNRAEERRKQCREGVQKGTKLDDPSQSLVDGCPKEAVRLPLSEVPKFGQPSKPQRKPDDHGVLHLLIFWHLVDEIPKRKVAFPFKEGVFFLAGRLGLVGE